MYYKIRLKFWVGGAHILYISITVKVWSFTPRTSLIPLKIWTYVGVIVSLLAFLYAIILVIRTLVLGIDIPGYASLMVAVLSLGGIQIMTLGIMGEYLGRVYEEVKRHPLYLVRDIYGFENQSSVNPTFSRAISEKLSEQ